MRTCITCGEQKKSWDFYPYTLPAKGRSIECKACTKAHTAAHRSEYPNAAAAAKHDANISTGRHLTRGFTEESRLLDTSDYFFL